MAPLVSFRFQRHIKEAWTKTSNYQRNKRQLFTKIDSSLSCWTTASSHCADFTTSLIRQQNGVI